MAQFIVTNVFDGANMRKTPSASGQLIRNLPFGTRLERIADTPGNFKEMRIVQPGAAVTGFVSIVNLTEARTDAIARLIEAAAFYWELFDRGEGREDVQPFKRHVLKLWEELGMGSPPGDNTSHPDWPWSAAGMCAFIRKAGGYTGFKPSRRHARYIHDSIVKMKAGQPAPFWGFRINEKKPEVGDLIAQWRVTRIDYDFAAAHGDFSSHTDVVCQVLGDRVRAIGANVPTDTVGVKVYRLDDQGFLKGSRNEIAIMKNMAT